MKRKLVMMKMAFLLLGAAFVAVFSLIVMLLWNALIPGLFGGPLLSFWQAAGLLVLSRILLGGFGGHGGPRGGWHHRMSPEERERFREGMQHWKQMNWNERREFRRGFAGGCGRAGEQPHEEKGRAAE